MFGPWGHGHILLIIIYYFKLLLDYCFIFYIHNLNQNLFIYFNIYLYVLYQGHLYIKDIATYEFVPLYVYN